VAAFLHYFIVIGLMVPVGSEAPIRADIGENRIGGLRNRIGVGCTLTNCADIS
jgi:hypothetical protein